MKVVFIPKPGKSDYTKHRNLRPISLSSFLLKTIQHTIDWDMRRTLKNESAPDDADGDTMTEVPKNGSLLDDAFMPGKSTETALHRLVTCIESGLKAKEMVLCTFLDIEGAFNNLTFQAVDDALGEKKVSPVMKRWVFRMLSQRQIKADRGNCTVNATVKRGCPQGGVCP